MSVPPPTPHHPTPSHPMQSWRRVVSKSMCILSGGVKTDRLCSSQIWPRSGSDLGQTLHKTEPANNRLHSVPAKTRQDNQPACSPKPLIDTNTSIENQCQWSLHYFYCHHWFSLSKSSISILSYSVTAHLHDISFFFFSICILHSPASAAVVME